MGTTEATVQEIAALPVFHRITVPAHMATAYCKHGGIFLLVSNTLRAAKTIIGITVSTG